MTTKLSIMTQKIFKNTRSFRKVLKILYHHFYTKSSLYVKDIIFGKVKVNRGFYKRIKNCFLNVKKVDMNFK